MPLVTKRIYRISDTISSLNPQQIGVQSTADTDLGFKMYGGKDGAGDSTLWLAKDQDARVADLYGLPGDDFNILHRRVAATGTANLTIENSANQSGIPAHLKIMCSANTATADIELEASDLIFDAYNDVDMWTDVGTITIQSKGTTLGGVVIESDWFEFQNYTAYSPIPVWNSNTQWAAYESTFGTNYPILQAIVDGAGGGGGVSSVNALTGALTLTAGPAAVPGILITTTGPTSLEVQVQDASATEINYNSINGSTYKDVQSHLNFMQGPCKLVSTEGTISDAGSGLINVSAGNGIVKASDTENAETMFFEWSAATGLVPTDDSVNYVFVAYHATSPPVIISTTASLTDRLDYILLGMVKREGTDLDIRNFGACNDWVWRINRKSSIQNNFGPEYGSGIIIGDEGTRYISLTAGVIFFGLGDASTDALDTSGAGTFDTFYTTDSGTTWVETASQTQIDNLNYNDITSGLTALGNNQYGVHWVYYDYSGDHCYVLYGVDSHLTIAGATDEAEPPNKPWQINQWGFLVGKVIIQKSATEITDVISVFIDDVAGGSSVSNHNNLSGIQGGSLAQYYHLDSDDYTDLTTNLPIGNGAIVFGNSGGELDHDVAYFYNKAALGLWQINNSGASGSVLFSLHGNARGSGGGGASNVELKALTTDAVPTVDIYAESDGTGTPIINLKAANAADTGYLYVKHDRVDMTVPIKVTADITHTLTVPSGSAGKAALALTNSAVASTSEVLNVYNDSTASDSKDILFGGAAGRGHTANQTGHKIWTSSSLTVGHSTGTGATLEQSYISFQYDDTSPIDYTNVVIRSDWDSETYYAQIKVSAGDNDGNDYGRIDITASNNIIIYPSGNLTLQSGGHTYLHAGGSMWIDDGFRSGSTWATSTGIRVSAALAEWTAMETLGGGEVSLFALISAAASSGGSQPNTQLVYGTGTGFGSDSSFTFNDATNILKFGNTTTEYGTIKFDETAQTFTVQSYRHDDDGIGQLNLYAQAGGEGTGYGILELAAYDAGDKSGGLVKVYGETVSFENVEILSFNYTGAPGYIDFNSADLREIDAVTFNKKDAVFSAGTLTVNATTGAFQEEEFAADITTFTIGAPTSNDCTRITLWLKNTDSSAHTIGGIGGTGQNLISPLATGHSVAAGATVHMTLVYRDATWGWDIALSEYS